MSRTLFRGAVCTLLFLGTLRAMGQQQAGDSIGKTIERGVREAESKLRETWADVKRATHRMTIQGRVYARLYWDKSLNNAALTIETKDDGVVILKGSVGSIAAKRRAVDLAQSTVGVERTLDKLAVAPPPRQSNRRKRCLGRAASNA